MPIDISDATRSWLQCPGCGYQFVDPPIPRERLVECYSRAAADLWETAHDVARDRFYSRKKALLKRYSCGNRVLDFGCFDGGFLSYLGDDFVKLGIEPAAAAATIARQRGVEVIGKTVDDARDIEPVDAIVALDVFEHVGDPVGVLRALSRFLNPAGIILIETGNSDTRIWKRVGVRYPYMSTPEHVGVFNRSSISAAARRARLQVLRFIPGPHARLTLTEHAVYPLYNLVYAALRALDAANAPLPASARSVARGPLPRSTAEDHFIAVLGNGGRSSLDGKQLVRVTGDL